MLQPHQMHQKPVVHAMSHATGYSGLTMRSLRPGSAILPALRFQYQVADVVRYLNQLYGDPDILEGLSRP